MRAIKFNASDLTLRLNQRLPNQAGAFTRAGATVAVFEVWVGAADPD